MKGMAIVGPHEMPALPGHSQVMDFNTVANEMFNEGKYKEAVVEYSRALDFAPTDPLILWNRSAAYVLLGHYHAALHDITRCAKLLPPAETILFRLAGIQILAHEPQKALSTLRRLGKTSEVLAAKDLATLIIQAEDSLGEGACYNPEFAVVAIAVAEMKIRVPLPREWIMLRVRGKFETDDLNGAEEALNQIPQEKITAEILLWKGKARLFRDKYLEAAELFQEATDNDPECKDAVTYLELSVAFQAKFAANVAAFGFGDTNKAVRVLSEALQTNLAHPPTKAKYLCYRAACLISLGYLAAAQLDCESALYHVPDLARAKRIHQQAASQMAANEAALRKDYYKLLGLERGRRYTDDELTQAWKQTLVKYLPEKVGDEDRAKLITADVHVAYNTLKNPEKRKEYDSGYERARRNSFNIVVSS